MTHTHCACNSEFTVIWNGRGSLPWQVIDPAHYRQVTRPWHERESFNRGDLPTAAECARIILADRQQELHYPGYGRRGRKASATTHDRFCPCGRKKRMSAPKCSGCYKGQQKRAA